MAYPQTFNGFRKVLGKAAEGVNDSVHYELLDLEKESAILSDIYLHWEAVQDDIIHEDDLTEAECWEDHCLIETVIHFYDAIYHPWNYAPGCAPEPLTRYVKTMQIDTIVKNFFNLTEDNNGRAS